MENNKTLEMLERNLPALSECLENMDGNSDLALTQLVAGLNQYWGKNHPDDHYGVQIGLENLQKILSCIFYGDENAQLDIEESCDFGSLGCSGGKLEALMNNFDKHIDDVGWSLRWPPSESPSIVADEQLECAPEADRAHSNCCC